MMFGPALVSRKLPVGHCIPALARTEIIPQYDGFWKFSNSVRQSSRFLHFMLSSVSSYELPSSAGASSLGDGCHALQ